jgi:hypothetical protein
MLQKPTREGEQKDCPECGGKIISKNKPYEGQDRLSWRNPDQSSHQTKDSLGKWVHVKSKEEADKAKKGDWNSKSVSTQKVAAEEKPPVIVWPKLPELTDDQQALYAADDLVEAMAVEKTRLQHPGLEESNPNVFGQIVSAKSQRIAFVNLAKVFRDHLV